VSVAWRRAGASGLCNGGATGPAVIVALVLLLFPSITLAFSLNATTHPKRPLTEVCP
jgi:hypothetical protein